MFDLTYVMDQCHQALCPPPNKRRNGNRDWVWGYYKTICIVAGWMFDLTKVISIMTQFPIRLHAWLSCHELTNSKAFCWEGSDVRVVTLGIQTRSSILRHYSSINIPMRLRPLAHLDMHQLLRCPHTMTGSLSMISHTKGALCICEVNLKTHFITSHSHWDYDLQWGNMSREENGWRVYIRMCVHCFTYRKGTAVCTREFNEIIYITSQVMPVMSFCFLSVKYL